MPLLRQLSVAVASALLSPLATSQCPETLAVPRTSHAATSVGSLILIGGGYGPNGHEASVEIYDTTTGTWSQSALSAGRTGLAATSWQNRAFFAGGGVSTPLFQTDHTTAVDIYDAFTGQWTLEQLSVPRSGLSAGAIGGGVFFAGGWNSPTPPLQAVDVVEVYDVVTAT